MRLRTIAAHHQRRQQTVRRPIRGELHALPPLLAVLVSGRIAVRRRRLVQTAAVLQLLAQLEDGPIAIGVQLHGVLAILTALRVTQRGNKNSRYQL